MTDLLGQTIGNYQIDLLLGTGGMGQVYRGHHAHLARQAAIKVMHPQLAVDPRFRERFLREVKSAEMLKHQHIVTIFDFGEQHGHYYLVMELLQNGSLRSLLRSRADRSFTWPVSLGIDLVRQAAEALAFAHQNNVIHLDIKPDNLLLLKQTDADNYSIKVSDFGLARVIEENSQAGFETWHSGPLGTPAYMSPEQCQGLALSARSDVYSLGVVLYEVVTGRLPVAAKNINEALSYHLTVLQPPSPRQFCPELPIELEEVILRCLAKEPDQRYGTTAELIDALNNVRRNRLLESLFPDVPAADAAPLTPVQADEAPAAPAPAFVPQVQLFDALGQPKEVFELTTGGLTVGRLGKNTISRDDPALGRYHLRIGWDGTQATVTDLGSRAGSTLDDELLPPYQPRPWAWGQLLRVGSFFLRLDQRVAGNRQDALLAGAATQSTQTARVANERIGVAFVGGQEAVQLVPNQPQLMSVLLTNHGTVPDTFTLAVEGVPPGWIELPTKPIPLGSGLQTSVMFRITVPMASSSRAGAYPITVRARSQAIPEEYGQALTTWRVAPFVDSELSISPKRVQSRDLAHYTVTIRNAGNSTMRYALQADDQEQRLGYQFSQPQIDVKPGTAAEVALTTESERRMVGGERRHRFNVLATDERGEAAETSAVFVQQSVIPFWMLLPILLFTLLGLVGVSSLARPAATTADATAVSSDTIAPVPVAASNLPTDVPFLATQPPGEPSQNQLPLISIQSGRTIGEGEPCRLTLSLSRLPDQPASIKYVVSGNPEDYVSAEEGAQVVVFDATLTSTLSLQTRDNPNTSAPRDLVVTLTEPQNGRVNVSAAQGRCTILQDNPNGSSFVSQQSVADVTLQARDDPDPVQATGTLAYTITITNNGPNNARNLQLNSAISGLVRISGIQQTGWTCSGTAKCTLPSLRVGASSIIRINGRTLDGSNSIVSTFSVDVPDDSNSLNNSSEVVTTVRSNRPTSTPVPGSAPSIIQQPADQQIAVGASANLVVSASGTAPLQYQWYQGQSGNTGNPLNGETFAGFTTPNLSSTTSYWVRVQNSAGSVDSRTVTVIVQTGGSGTPPSITSQPQDQQVGRNGNATLAVGASGSATLQYQWYQGGSGDISAPISGAVGTTYTTPSLATTTTYWVRVTNGAGTADSRTATVAVQGSSSGTPPNITQQPQSQQIGTGNATTLSVGASGSGSLRYRWYQGKSGTTTTLLQDITGSQGSQYVTPNLRATTEYWVLVSNDAGSAASDTATITVQSTVTGSKPQIISLSQSRETTKRTDVPLQVSATGSSPFSYQWYLGQTGNTSSPISGATSSTYSFTTGDNSGDNFYWVRVSNSSGSDDSTTVRVTVINRAPSFTTFPENGTPTGGNQVTYTISASDPDGDPVSFTASGKPDSLVLQNNGNGNATLSGRLPANTTFNITITARDNENASTSGSFSLTVLSPTATNTPTDIPTNTPIDTPTTAPTLTPTQPSGPITANLSNVKGTYIRTGTSNLNKDYQRETSIVVKSIKHGSGSGPISDTTMRHGIIQFELGAINIDNAQSMTISSTISLDSSYKQGDKTNRTIITKMVCNNFNWLNQNFTWNAFYGKNGWQDVDAFPSGTATISTDIKGLSGTDIGMSIDVITIVRANKNQSECVNSNTITILLFDEYVDGNENQPSVEIDKSNLKIIVVHT